MKITLSKTQWEHIGAKAGWIKTSKVIAEQTPEQIQEDIGKLEKVSQYLREIGSLMDQVRAREIPMLEESNSVISLYKNVTQAIRFLKNVMKSKPKAVAHAKSQNHVNKNAQNLEVVKTPDKLTDREITRALRDAIIAEEAAIKQYETVVDASGNEKVKEVLQEIADEERVHVGEIQTLLNILLPDEKNLLDEGAKEVSEKK